jgi:hypothetical protein
MERLVDSYIRAEPLKSFPLMESQYAYQRGRSTEAALHDIVQKIEGSWNQKEFSLDVFLDIDGAFDNASFGSMDILTLRSDEIRGGSVRMLVNRGCLQGEVLSLDIFNVRESYMPSLRFSCYDISIQSICYFGVFGILEY